ncbi:tRNA pseudouridine(55) synthase TruB, partial [Candidatus Saccharibacteria bacterium]|nr:tRNA pseudouridine(55) synthase TruB [Candidatus Saccharibacteria bacterium]
IFSIELLEFNYPYVKIRAHVSSGTYIRTLVEDVGKELGVGAYTTELRRTKIGEYDVGDALDLCLFEAATAQSE